MASICNDERVRFGVLSGHDRRTLSLSGPQRQGGLTIQQDGQRLAARSPAPLLGEHSEAVLQQHAAIGPAQFEALLAAGVVSFSPKPARNLVADADQSVATWR